MGNDPNVLNGIDELRQFLAEHPDAQIASIKRISTNKYTGEQTSQVLFDKTPSQNQQYADQERKHREEQQRRREEQQKRQQEEAKKKLEEYEKAVDAWEKETNDIGKKRSAKLKELLASEEEKRQKEISDDFAKEVRTAAKNYAEAELEEQRLQEDVNALGGLRRSEKKQLQNALEEARNRKNDAKNKANAAQESKEKNLKDIQNFLNSSKKRLETEIIDRFPMPQKPSRSKFLSYQEQVALDSRGSSTRMPTSKQIENEGFKDDIMAYMEPDKIYTAEEILRGVPSIVAAGMSINRVSALLTQLTESGYVTRTVEKRKYYFQMS